jgi:hypothetical protein
MTCKVCDVGELWGQCVNLVVVSRKGLVVGCRNI